MRNEWNILYVENLLLLFFSKFKHTSWVIANPLKSLQLQHYSQKSSTA